MPNCPLSDPQNLSRTQPSAGQLEKWEWFYLFIKMLGRSIDQLMRRASFSSCMQVPVHSAANMSKLNAEKSLDLTYDSLKAMKIIVSCFHCGLQGVSPVYFLLKTSLLQAAFHSSGRLIFDPWALNTFLIGEKGQFNPSAEKHVYSLTLPDATQFHPEEATGASCIQPSSVSVTRMRSNMEKLIRHEKNNMGLF